MKKTWGMLLGLAVVLTLIAGVYAADEKEKTLKGTITCAKCDLKKEKACTNVIVVKEGDKEVVYYFDDTGAKEKYHKDICRESKKGSVTGIVSEKEGKKMIKPSKDGVKFD